MDPSPPSLLIAPDQQGLISAAEDIAKGNLVAFPTETVYGLGANALDASAVLSIFEAKGRPLTDPLIVHVHDIQSAKQLISVSPETERVFMLLANQFWPGPLTIIVKAASCVPMVVTADTGYVGIRMPAHPLALEFLKACRLPIAAPSANRFGHVSPTRAQHVLDDLGNKGVRVLDGDSAHASFTCLHGIESTVLRINAEDSSVTILRQGAISQRDVAGLLKGEGLSEWVVKAIHRAIKHTSASTTDTVASGEEPAVAPGQLLTHYAPDVPCYVLASAVISPDVSTYEHLSYPPPESEEAVREQMQRYTQSSLLLSSAQMKSDVVVIDFQGQLRALASGCLAYRDLSPSGNMTEAARGLFAALRWSELVPQAGKVILAPIVTCADKSGMEPVDRSVGSLDAQSSPSLNKSYDPELGLADRILRAASGVAIELVINED
eukprot:CAMPEP_0185041296 /NCGR_PEP_ID=MMETSP1103-20130426/40370_1 /TAXON_ID=36769 /ORGANISM="Paraphysomonas bandaiensis, Strain Caron Lab Isolate" /LENGTH=436 /DNA_ID=CAMNT_0027580949 /DNA_START=37 /DNA_END=1347 /DNA_ORIENTATION=-